MPPIDDDDAHDVGLRTNAGESLPSRRFLVHGHRAGTGRRSGPLPSSCLAEAGAARLDAIFSVDRNMVENVYVSANIGETVREKRPL